MFLFDPAVTPDWDSVKTELDRILGRSEARLIAGAKWDERRLAYEIHGRRRGIYALTYFEAEAARVVDIERDVNLSESALRCLLLRVDHMSEDDMKEAAERPASSYADEGPRGRGDGDDRGGRGPRASSQQRSGGGDGDSSSRNDSGDQKTATATSEKDDDSSGE
jgi:small subunit ribosomal protein S6